MANIAELKRARLAADGKPAMHSLMAAHMSRNADTVATGKPKHESRRKSLVEHATGAVKGLARTCASAAERNYLMTMT